MSGYKALKQGSGPIAKSGAICNVVYRIKLVSTGKIHAASGGESEKIVLNDPTAWHHHVIGKA